MGVKVEALTNRIIASLRDANQDSWPEPVIHESIFEAEKVVTNYRPDATAVDAEHTCDPGIRQFIGVMNPPPHRLLDVKYNIVSGNPSRSVRRVAVGDLDAIRPDWRSATPTQRVKEFMHDPREPLLFYVNPPVSAGTRVQISYSAVPGEYGDVDENTETTVDGVYEPMLVEWALYRLFGHDVEGSVNIQRSQGHLNNFQNMMGVKIQGESAYGPKNMEHKR